MKSITLHWLARVARCLAPAAVLLGLFLTGYHQETAWRDFKVQYRTRLVERANPWLLLRAYYTRFDDELLYYEYGSLLVGAGAPERTKFGPLIRLQQPITPGHVALPYRDFHAEYPLLSFLPIVAPRLLTRDPMLYRVLFAVEVALLFYVCLWVAWRLRRRHGEAVAFASVAAQGAWLAFLVGPLLIRRLDLFLAASLLLAYAALWRRRWGWSSVALALGAALKFVPGLLLPIPTMIAWRRDGRRAGLRTAAGGGAVLAGFLLAQTLLSTHGTTDMLQHHTARGLQIESVYALAIEWWSRLQGAPLRIMSTAFSEVLDAPLAAMIAPWTMPTLALMVAFVVGLVSLHRGVVRPFQWLPSLLLPILAFILAAPIASPQFVIWPLPLVLAAVGPAGRQLRRGYAWYAAATQLQFNGGYYFLAKLHPVGIATLSLRWLAFGHFLWIVIRAWRTHEPHPVPVRAVA